MPVPSAAPTPAELPADEAFRRRWTSPDRSDGAGASRPADQPDAGRRPIPTPHIELDFRTPLELLVATILSAQTTDKRVNLVTPVLFARYPDAAAYAAADRAELEALITPTGFFRAKTDTLLKLGAALVERSTARCRARWPSWSPCPASAARPRTSCWATRSACPGITVDTHFGRLSRRFGWTDRDRPGEGRGRGRRAVPAQGLDPALPQRDLARPPPLPRPQPGLRRLPGRALVPGVRRGRDRPGQGGQAGPRAARMSVRRLGCAGRACSRCVLVAGCTESRPSPVPAAATATRAGPPTAGPTPRPPVADSQRPGGAEEGGRDRRLPDLRPGGGRGAPTGCRTSSLPLPGRRPGGPAGRAARAADDDQRLGPVVRAVPGRGAVPRRGRRREPGSDAADPGHRLRRPDPDCAIEFARLAGWRYPAGRRTADTRAAPSAAGRRPAADLLRPAPTARSPHRHAGAFTSADQIRDAGTRAPRGDAVTPPVAGRPTGWPADRCARRPRDRRGRRSWRSGPGWAAGRRRCCS